MFSSVIYYVILFSTAPTGSPTIIMTISTRDTITVQWEEVDCIDRNGLITCYRIHVMTSGEDDRIETVDDVREGTISGLTPSTEYTVSVAAVNSQDTGPYSAGMMVETAGMMYIDTTYYYNS